jgi:hypothetical protein
MVEYWFVVFFDKSIFVLSSTQILPSTQHCIIPEPIIPLFHHSNWGVATNFDTQKARMDRRNIRIRDCLMV